MTERRPERKPVGRLATDSLEWGVRPAHARVASLLPWAAAVALAATLVWRPLFRFLTEEDGPIEWAQFVILMAAAVVLSRLALAAGRRGARWWAVAVWIGALTLLFIAGEEISWGQRILGWETPDFLEDLNHQDEANLHNIGVAERAFGLAELVGGTYGALAWLAPRRLRARLGPLGYVAVPAGMLAGAFGLAAAYRAVRYVAFPASGFVVTKFGELPELALYAALLAAAVLSLRRLQRDGATSGDPLRS